MAARVDGTRPISLHSLLLQRFHEAWERLEGTGATLGGDSGEGGGESRGGQWGGRWRIPGSAVGAAGFLGAGPYCGVGLLCVPVGGAARPSGSSGALRSLRTGGAFAADVARRVALLPIYGCEPSIPHVIPRRLIQTSNLHRWNCNVFGASRKMTAINYVRDLCGGPVAAHGCRSQEPPMGAVFGCYRPGGLVV